MHELATPGMLGISPAKDLIMISADVTTKKRPEEFNKCEWIPEKGETENITFVIITTSSKSHNSHFVSDLAVVGYN